MQYADKLISSKSPHPPRWRGRVVFAAILFLLGAAGVALTIAAFFGERGWRLELITHFRLQYGTGLALIASALALLKYTRSVAVFALAAAVNLALPVSYYFGRPAPPPAGAPRLKIMFLNIEINNFKYELTRALIEKEQPDVLALVEVNTPALEALRPATASYPHRIERAGSHAFGIAVYARVPMTGARQIPVPPLNAATITAQLPLGDRHVNALFTHIMSPQSPAALGVRNGQLDNLARWAREQPPPVLLVGDFNCTPFSLYFKNLLRNTGLRDSARGFGWQATWPGWFRPLFIPIDHAFVGPGLTVVERRVGPDVGSDHRAVILTIALAPSG